MNGIDPGRDKLLEAHTRWTDVSACLRDGGAGRARGVALLAAYRTPKVRVGSGRGRGAVRREECKIAKLG